MTDREPTPGAEPARPALTDPADRLPPLNHDVASRAAEATLASSAWSARHLRGCWLGLLAAGALLAVTGALVVGPSAALGALVGILVVGAFFTVSTVVISFVGRRHPKQLMWAALLTYTAKMIALFVVIVVIPRDGPIDTRWMAAGVGIGVMVWLAAHFRYVWTTKIFYVDPH